jgi:hypothetical protein
MINKRSQTPQTFLPLKAGGGGSGMKQFPGGPHPYVPSYHCILPPHSKHLPLIIFPTHHHHLDMSHPKTTSCKSHFLTPSACPLHLTITGHIFFVYFPITTLHVDWVHMSYVFHLAPSCSKGPVGHLLLATYPLFT